MPPKKKGAAAQAGLKKFHGTVTDKLADMRGKLLANSSFGGEKFLTKPRKIKGCGGQLPDFCQKTMQDELKRCNEFICEGNIFWLADATDGVPIRSSAVADVLRLKYGLLLSLSYGWFKPPMPPPRVGFRSDHPNSGFCVGLRL